MTKNRLALLALIGLAGCAVGPDYRAPATVLPPTFAQSMPRNAARSQTAMVPPSLTHWWTALNDPELNSLITRALQANPDLDIALGHLQEARTQEAGLAGTLLPSISAGAAAGRGTGSDLSRAANLAALRAADNKGSLPQIRQVAGFSASWELDLMGGYRRSLEASRYDIGAAEAARDAVLISVVGDLARNYIDLRGLQVRVALLGADIGAATQSADLAQARFDRGITNELDVQLARRELSTLRAQLPLLLSQISITQGDIAVLVGVYPQTLAAELSRPGDLPTVLPTVDPGLPPQLLRRRPDIRQAERNLAAATARIGVATDALFPHLVLTGAAGTQSALIGLKGGHIWSAGPALYWPLLDFGALDAKVDVADLQAHEQLTRYRKTVIVAVQDAERTIADYSAQQQRITELQQAVTASERAVSLAQQRYERGLTDFLNVVDAQRQQYQLAERYSSARQRAAEAFITLCQSLGGDWESYQSVPDIRRPEPAIIAAVHRLALRDRPGTP
jgi:NodT family efflux transporter outer membrane factor (OMF) lipoprotein